MYRFTFCFCFSEVKPRVPSSPRALHLNTPKLSQPQARSQTDMPPTRDNGTQALCLPWYNVRHSPRPDPRLQLSAAPSTFPHLSHLDPGWAPLVQGGPFGKAGGDGIPDMLPVQGRHGAVSPSRVTAHLPTTVCPLLLPTPRRDLLHRHLVHGFSPWLSLLSHELPPILASKQCCLWLCSRWPGWTLKVQCSPSHTWASSGLWQISSAHDVFFQPHSSRFHLPVPSTHLAPRSKYVTHSINQA